MRRLVLLAAALVPVLAAGAWFIAGFFDDDSPPGAAHPLPRRPLVPNLVMPPLADVRISWDDRGSRRVLFSATIANVGDGPFQVHAQRSGGGARWLVTQRFREPDGSTTEQPVPEARMVWGGHGHDHWHVALGASYVLVDRSATGDPVRSLVKAGYCFFDQKAYRRTLPGAPARGVYLSRGCAGTDATDLDMGLSVGWSDPYYWILPDQRIDVTGVEPGEYRLIATADPDGWFRETDETDNETWVDIRIGEGPDRNPTLDVLAVAGEPR